jgi:5-methylcytosine-specific restriction endonuclease McrA
MTKRQKFYRSDRWVKFIANLKDQRADESGVITCAICGQPIVKKYDCIGHHKTELTEENVDDVNIALNPENVELIHFKCHNKVHNRFVGGYLARKPQQVFIVYGSPCSGKRTWVAEQAEDNDIIVDIDRLWKAISCSEKPSRLKTNVFQLRDVLIDQIKVRQGRWLHAYIIGGYPLTGERERLADLVNADDVIYIDTPKNICIERATKISEEMVGYVNDWWERYTPPVE